MARRSTPERIAVAGESGTRGWLMHAYPGVQVRRQAELARLAHEEVWYAYRDGRPAHATESEAN
jgi:hypothetical protein